MTSDPSYPKWALVITNFPAPDRIDKELNLTKSEIEQFYQ